MGMKKSKTIHPSQSRIPADQTVSITSQSNAFSFDLYAKLSRNEPGKNLVFSPYSVSSAMSMVLLGCGGESKSELENVLRLGNFSQSRDAVVGMHPTETNGLCIANKLFIEKSFEIKETFVRDLQRFHKSEIEAKDFLNEPEKSRNDVNDWVCEATKGKIKNLMPPRPDAFDTRLVVANAIYFRRTWELQFDKSKTFTTDFHVNSKKTVKVSMMNKVAYYSMATCKGAKILELRYEASTISMIILLPNGNIKTSELSLTCEKFSKMYGSLRKGNVQLQLPKFKIEYEKDLVQSFKDLGVKSIFTGDADFGGICDSKGLYVSDISHKACIEVDEYGTEAAAATTTRLMVKCQPEKFICNKPFLYFIFDSATNSILFMGRVMNPAE